MVVAARVVKISSLEDSVVSRFHIRVERFSGLPSQVIVGLVIDVNSDVSM